MLVRLDWDDSYSVGIDKVDTQHKELVSIINELYDIVIRGDEVYRRKLSIVFKKLTAYTIYHFETEEALMTKYEYPIVDFHKMQHSNFIKELTYQVAQLTDSASEGGYKLYIFLATWLFTHIEKADKAWARFIIPKIR